MTERRFTEQQLSATIRRLRADRATHDARLKVRRLLIEMAVEAAIPGNGTGTNVPKPYDRSQLIIQVLSGDVVQAVQQFTGMISHNQPNIAVTPIAVNKDITTQKVDSTAGEQERLIAALFDAVDARPKQRQVTWSSVWGRVGWYFTLPRDKSWGLPDRDYYGDLTDDELRALKEAGKATPEPISAPDGSMKYAESGTSYLERRKEASKQRAISSRSLFTLTTYAPDVVYPEFDGEGVLDPKAAAVVLEVPASHFGPGSEYARAHHGLSGSTEDISKYGLYFDRAQNRVVGGVNAGGEPGVHAGQTWTYSIYATRDEVYCMASASPDGAGTLLWYAEHGGGTCPLVPVAAFVTDSMRPGGEYSSPMEAVFALSPIINQLETFLTNVAAWNAMGRWVIVKKDGSLIEDPKTGDPVTISSEKMLGANPGEVEIVGGEPMQLKVDADMLFKLLEFYALQQEKKMPSQAATGQEGNSGTAWGMRQAIEQALAGLREPVDNHALAIKKIALLWIRWMREIDTPIYAFSVPGKRADRRSVRGLIEFDPANLVDSITVEQSSDTAQAKIVKMQAGIEAKQAGVETTRGYFEKYTDEQDPRQAEIELDAFQIEQMALFGDTSQIQPGSVFADVVKALRGEMSQKMIEGIPSVALSTAAQMASAAQQQAAQTTAATTVPGTPEGGNVAEAAGLRQPGTGMSLTGPTGMSLQAPIAGAP